MAKATKPCPVCGQPITDWPCVIAKRKTCSDSCRAKLFVRSDSYKNLIKTRRNPFSSYGVDLICAHCKKEFHVGALRAQKGAKFCSRACMADHAKAGNKRVYYKSMTAPDGRHLGIHRYLMEVKLGRRLGTKEEVNHINGNKRDNRVENLEVLLKSDHCRISRTQYANSVLVPPDVPRITK